MSLAELADPELVDAMAAGDARALAILYDRYARAVFSLALRMLGDRSISEEVLQGAFFRTWRQARKFRAGRGASITWLLSITHNTAIDEIRKQNRHPRKTESDDPMLLLTNMPDDNASVEDQAVFETIRDQVTGAMAALPERQRITIELTYFQGLTQGEIAELQREPLGTVKTRMRRGVRKLREHLDDQGVERQ